MRVVFRVDASLQMGSGHVMRCLTLANELQQQGHNITFICRELIGNLNTLVEQTGHEVITLPVNTDFKSDNIYLDWLGATQKQDAEQTIEVISKNTDLLIVDNYALDEIWHQQLRPFTKKIMVIDDLANRGFDCNILLNQNLGIKKEEYKDKVSDECQLLLGCEYALLRPEFAQLRSQALEKRKNTKEIKNILISLGGSDKENLTHEILKDINNDLDIKVVLGSSSPHNEMIKQYAQNENITIIIDANNMAELMLDADLAIGAGGSTSWERCCLGLPTLVFVTSDNEQKIASNLEGLNAVKIVKNFEQDFQTLINDFILWQKMSSQAKSVCDGVGANRIIKNIITND